MYQSKIYYKLELLSKRSSSKSQLKNFHNVFKMENKGIFQNNQFTNGKNSRNSRYVIGSSISGSGSKQKFSKSKSYEGSSREKTKSRDKLRQLKQKFINQNIHKIKQEKHKVKQFDLHNMHNLKKKQKSSKHKSTSNLLKNKCKSMIRLPKFEKNLADEQSKQKIGRKSYSPIRNHSEGLKRTNPNNCSNQCIKTTKFTQSKENVIPKISKRMQAGFKGNKKSKKQKQEKHKKSTKSKQKQLIALVSNRPNNLSGTNKNSYLSTRRKQAQIFNTIQLQKNLQANAKKSKKTSPNKRTEINKKKTYDQIIMKASTKNLKQKQSTKNLPKKRKSVSKSKKNLHFQSVDQRMMRQNVNLQSTTGQINYFDNYLSNRDSFKKKVKTDRDSFNKVKKKPSIKQSQFKQKSKDKQVIISVKQLKKIRNEAATKIQKVYKGYITRKWLNEYLKIINAAVIIQKHWRGYLARKSFNYQKQKATKLKQSKRLGQLSRLKIRQPQISKASNNVHRQSLGMENSNLSVDMIDKWKDILMEVMAQKTVNLQVKQKIKNFLENQGQSARSSMLSRRSHNSEQKLKQEMLSQRRFFQKQCQKKQVSKSSYLNNSSPISRGSLQREPSVTSESSSPQVRPALNSPQMLSQLFSPENTKQFSPKLKKLRRSPDQVLTNLYEIQNYQRQNMIQHAQVQKKQLHELLQKNIFSPRTCEAKKKQIDLKLQKQIKDFQKNINGVIESCKKTQLAEGSFLNLQSMEPKVIKDFNSQLMITPEHSYLKQQKQSFIQEQMISRSLQKYKEVETMLLVEQSKRQTIIQKQVYKEQPQPSKKQLSPSLNLSNQKPTYEHFQTFNINALSSQKSQNIQIQTLNKIDKSCNFLDQYLLTLIEYLRGKDQGKIMLQIIRSVKSWKNLDPITIMRNLSTVKDQKSDDDQGFGLPLYKYLEDDAEIITQQYVSDYNKYFNMMKCFNTHFENNASYTKQSQKNKPVQTSQPQNQAIQHYLKLLIDAFNQALNMKRPCKFIFTNRSIQTFNSKSIVQRQQYDAQQQYDVYCASAMQEIFTWFNLKYGCVVSYNNKGAQDDAGIEQQLMVQNANRLQQMMKMEAQKKWDEYYQMVEVIGKLTEMIEQDVLIMEILTILNVGGGLSKQRKIFV